MTRHTHTSLKSCAPWHWKNSQIDMKIVDLPVPKRTENSAEDSHNLGRPRCVAACFVCEFCLKIHFITVVENCRVFSCILRPLVLEKKSVLLVPFNFIMEV
jgi:hypothetical protein